MALIAKYFKKLYKPTNNNLRTSSNSRNKNVYTTLRYVNENQTGQFRNQRTVTVVGARVAVGSQVVQQTGIQCYNCKEFGYFANECRKPKKTKDYTYHKEKMLLCKQAEKGVSLQAEQVDWLEDTDEELKKAKASLTQELKECKTTRAHGEYNITRDSCLIAFENQKIKIEKYKTYLNRTTEYDTLEHKLKETQTVLAQKENDIKEGLKLKAYEIYVVKKEHDELVKHSLLTKSSDEGLVKEKNKVIKDLKLKEENDVDKLIKMEKQLKFLNEIIPYDTSDPPNKFSPDREETLTLDQENRSKLNKDKVQPYDYTKQNSLYEIFKPPTREYLDQLAHANDVGKKM
ncbi:ribonuclease H-like domain-containing protein [Tanacetum coccineum]